MFSVFPHTYNLWRHQHIVRIYICVDIVFIYTCMHVYCNAYMHIVNVGVYIHIIYATHLHHLAVCLELDTSQRVRRDTQSNAVN